MAWLNVVGEVADVKLGAPDGEDVPQSYIQLSQFEEALGPMGSPSDNEGNDGSIVLRSAMPPEQMENALRKVVRSIDPQLPLTQVKTMNEVLAESEAPRRFNTVIITAFAAAAVLLAVLGIYSVIAFSVAARTQEMAIRMALGSQRVGILRLILTGGLKLAAIGCAVGLAGSVAASNLLRSMLFGVSPFDVPVLSFAAIAILLLTLAASAIPATRAASIDPVKGLRTE